jgi:hypothetical protein
VLPRFLLSLSAPSPANSALPLNSPFLAGRNVPSLAPNLAQDPILHNRLSEAFEQSFLRLTISQSH